MTWEYAFFFDNEKGKDHIVFTHDQHPDFGTYAKQVLGQGLYEKDTKPKLLHVNLRHTSQVAIIGFLGGAGWELVTTAEAQWSGLVWTFKRPMVSS